MMQGIMWIVLGATVGLAALVSHHRRTSIDVKLGDAISHRGVTVQLPKGWEIVKTADKQSAVVVTATEKKNDDDEEGGARVLKITREPLGSYRSPIEYALSQLHPGGGASKIIQGQDYFPIDNSPGEVLYQVRDLAPTSLRDARQGGRRRVKTICAATVAPSGRGIAIAMDADGDIDASDMELIKRIAATVKLADEPPLIDSTEVKLDNAVRVPIPADFSTARRDDALAMPRMLRGKNTTGPMRSITVLPIVWLPKDGSATLLTMLSLSGSDFEDAQVRPDSSGGFRADADPAMRHLLPVRAYSISRNNLGVIAIFRGGEDDNWIDETWQSMRDKIVFPDESNVDDLIANGTSAAKHLSESGLTPLLPEVTDDLWWVMCVNGPERAFGWTKYTPGANAGKFEGRVQFENQLQDVVYDWRGPADLKTYRVKSTYDISDLRDKDAPRKDSRAFDASLKAGKVDLRTGSAKPVTYPAPPNYIPGGWLPLILPKLVDRPMIIHTDSFIDYAYAQPRDLLTITLRPEPDAARSSDDTGTKMRCICVQVSGAIEKSRWFFRVDGTLDGIDYPDAQHLIRSDEHDVAMDFAHKEALRP